MTYIERLSLEFCPKVIKYFLTKQTFTKKPPSRPSPTQPLSPSLSPILSGEERPGRLPESFLSTRPTHPTHEVGTDRKKDRGHTAQAMWPL